jgi:hypothetical protein
MSKDCELKIVCKYPREPRKYSTSDMWRIYCNYLTESQKLRFRVEFLSGDCESHELGKGRNIINRTKKQAEVFAEEITLLGNLLPVIETVYEKALSNLEKFSDELEARDKVILAYVNDPTEENKANMAEVVKQLFESQAKGAFVQWKISKVLPDRAELFKDIKTMGDALSALSALLKASGNDGLISNGLDIVSKLLALIVKK